MTKPKTRAGTTSAKTGEDPKWLLMVHMLASAPNLQVPLGLDLEELSRPLKEMGKEATKAVELHVQVDTPTGVSKRFRLTADGPTAEKVTQTNPNTTLVDFVRKTT